MDNTETFLRSADSFLTLLGQIQPEHWELPGIGDWSVRSLAGHTARSIITVEKYLSLAPAGEVTVPTAEAYYSAITAMSADTADAAAVEARGVEAGKWLGSDPVPRVTETLIRAWQLLDSQPPGRAITVIGGLTLPLGEYLRTRVFELVVHSIDLSRATGIAAGLPTDALESAVTLASGLTVAQGHGEDVLLALTGRAPLPEGFSVV
ncbi:MAG: maleylpyruvate isomerase family mycothiol-dependent enzyme [Lacisediminihabitans sp.]